mmetsp:Transcript_40105/g.45825  ORF Transcript_40105/g.45825 Transcript_40105/m.45825 type:complete len:418 (+) Transcript_40105:24-1277(+)
MSDNRREWENFSRDIQDSLNRMRSNPSNFVGYLSDLEGNFNSSNNFIPQGRGGLQIKTKEGLTAHRDLIDYLQTAPSRAPFEHCSVLSKIAQDYCNSIAAMGSADSSDLVKTIKKYGELTGRVYFFYQLGFSADPQESLTTSLTCDGDKDRSNRANLLGEEFKQIGVGVGHSSASNHFVTLFLLTESFTPATDNVKIEYPSAALVDIRADDVSSNQQFSDDTQWTRLVRDIFEEQNKARSNPQEFARRLEQQLQFFDDKLLKLPGQIPLKTKEGKEAVLEAIAFLESQTPLPPLKILNGLSWAAQDHALDIGGTGKCGHEGATGSNPHERMTKYGRIQGYSSENIGFGERTGFGVLTQLIVDDGVPSRGHRKNVFNEHLTMTGVGVASHKKYGSCVVLSYAGNFIDETVSPVEYPQI